MGWLVAAAAFVMLVAIPIGSGLMITHAPRWKIQEASLGIPHEEVTVPTADGRALSAWYVPSRNGAALLVDHGSGGSRERVVAHVRMLARHGYGVLALDLPGNGESEGHSNGLGDNAQPAIDAGLDYLARRPDVDPDRIGGFGLSLGAEVLIQAAAGDLRLRAVVADGGARPQDVRAANDLDPLEGLVGDLQIAVVRGISGMRSSPSLNPPDRADRAAARAARRERRPAGDPHQPGLREARRPGDRALRAARCGAHGRAALGAGRVRAQGRRVPRPRARGLRPTGA